MRKENPSFPGLCHAVFTVKPALISKHCQVISSQTPDGAHILSHIHIPEEDGTYLGYSYSCPNKNVTAVTTSILNIQLLCQKLTDLGHEIKFLGKDGKSQEDSLQE